MGVEEGAGTLMPRRVPISIYSIVDAEANASNNLDSSRFNGIMGNVPGVLCCGNERALKGQQGIKDHKNAIAAFAGVLKDKINVERKVVHKSSNRRPDRYYNADCSSKGLWVSVTWGLVSFHIQSHSSLASAVASLQERPVYTTTYPLKIMAISGLLHLLDNIRVRRAIEKDQFNGEAPVLDITAAFVKDNMTVRFTGNNEVLTAFAVGCFEEDVLSQYAMGEKKWWRCEIEVTGNLLKRTRNNYPGAGAIINEAIKNMLKVDDQGYLSVCVGIYNFLYWNSHDSVCVDEAYCQLLLCASRLSLGVATSLRIWRCLAMLSRILAPSPKLNSVVRSWGNALLTIMTEQNGHAPHGTLPELIRIFLEQFRAILKTGSRLHFPCTAELTTQLLNAGEKEMFGTFSLRIWLPSGETILCSIPQAETTVQDTIRLVISSLGISPGSSELYHLYALNIMEDGKSPQGRQHSARLPRTILPEDSVPVIPGGDLPVHIQSGKAGENLDFSNAYFTHYSEQSVLHRMFLKDFAFTSRLHNMDGLSEVLIDEEFALCEPTFLLGSQVYREHVLHPEDLMHDSLGFCETIEKQYSTNFLIHIGLKSAVSLLYDRDDKDEIRLRFNEVAWDVISGRYDAEIQEIDAVSLAAVAIVAKFGSLHCLTSFLQTSMNHDEGEVNVESHLWKILDINVYVSQKFVSVVRRRMDTLIACIRALENATKHEARLLYWDYCRKSFFLFGARFYALESCHWYGANGNHLPKDVVGDTLVIGSSGVAVIDLSHGLIECKFCYEQIIFFDFSEDNAQLRVKHILPYEHEDEKKNVISDRCFEEPGTILLRGVNLVEAYRNLKIYWKDSV